MKKINEITEFSKLFKINIPVNEYFDYYIQTLSNSFEFKDIFSLVNSYSEFEEWLKENGYNNVGHYKMSYAYDKLKKRLEDSKAYTRCTEFNFPDIKFYTKDHLKMSEGNFLLSLDFASANFQSVKIFDKENDLKSSWKELCISLGIHPMLAESKSFRQIVFGNLNPKRFQKLQHYHIIKLVNDLGLIYPEEDFVFISYDELIINLGTDAKKAAEKAEKILDSVKEIKANHISSGETWMEIHPTILQMKKIHKGVYTKTIFYLTTPGVIIEAYKTLFGCPGNIYYMCFKEHILNEKIEDRDCVFMLDNRLAKWII